MIEGASDTRPAPSPGTTLPPLPRAWQKVVVDLKGQAGREVELRLVQSVLLPLPKCAGTALWRKIILE